MGRGVGWGGGGGFPHVSSRGIASQIEQRLVPDGWVVKILLKMNNFKPCGFNCGGSTIAVPSPLMKNLTSCVESILVPTELLFYQKKLLILIKWHIVNLSKHNEFGWAFHTTIPSASYLPDTLLLHSAFLYIALVNKVRVSVTKIVIKHLQKQPLTYL